MILYRYLDFHGGLKTLENSALKATRPNQFNDPFEYHIRATIKDKRKAFRKYIIGGKENDDLDRLARESLKKKGISTPTKKQIRQEGLQAKTDIRSQFDQTIQPDLDVMNATRLERISKNIAVTCFAQNENHNLMWSHYANGHHGILIEFDTKKGGEAFSDPYLKKIEYVKELPVVDLNDVEDVKNKFVLSVKKSDL